MDIVRNELTKKVSQIMFLLVVDIPQIKDTNTIKLESVPMATARPANLIPIIAATPEGTQKQADTIPVKILTAKKKTMRKQMQNGSDPGTKRSLCKEHTPWSIGKWYSKQEHYP